MATLTIAQIKAAKPFAQTGTFTFADYVLFLIYQNTYAGGSAPASSALASVFVDGGADGAEAATNLNTELTALGHNVYSVVPYVGNGGITGFIVVYYV